MKKIAMAAALTALMGAGSAQAWWGPWSPWGGWGPWGDRGWGNDWLGDGWFDFNFSMGAGGRGWGRSWDRYHYGPYWGYPYHGWGAPYAYPYAVAPVVPAAPATTEAK